jgi:hypothetical protein
MGEAPEDEWNSDLRCHSRSVARPGTAHHDATKPRRHDATKPRNDETTKPRSLMPAQWFTTEAEISDNDRAIQ